MLERLERDLLFRKSANSIAEALHTNVANLFELVKNESKTYGELQNNLNTIVKEIRWSDSNVGNFLTNEFQKLYEKEVGNTVIK